MERKDNLFWTFVAVILICEDRENKDWNWYALNAYTFVKQLKTDRNVLT